MSSKVTATEAKAKLCNLHEVVAASGDVEITNHGRPLAQRRLAAGPHSLRGKFAGVAITAVKDDELFSTDWAERALEQ